MNRLQTVTAIVDQAQREAGESGNLLIRAKELATVAVMVELHARGLMDAHFVNEWTRRWGPKVVELRATARSEQ